MASESLLFFPAGLAEANDAWRRNPDQVKERLDRLIGEIQKIQEPFVNGGTAPDVMVVRVHLSTDTRVRPATNRLHTRSHTATSCARS